MSRTWLYQTLLTVPKVIEYCQDRVFQSTAITEVPSLKPFILYRFGTTSNSLPGDDRIKVIDQPLQIFVHDVPGDYARIDTILRDIRDVLDGSYTSSVIRCRWAEESEDLRDDEMYTILRFARYQLTHT